MRRLSATRTWRPTAERRGRQDCAQICGDWQHHAFEEEPGHGSPARPGPFIASRLERLTLDLDQGRRSSPCFIAFFTPSRCPVGGKFSSHAHDTSMHGDKLQRALSKADAAQHAKVSSHVNFNWNYCSRSPHSDVARRHPIMAAQSVVGLWAVGCTRRGSSSGFGVAAAGSYLTVRCTIGDVK